MRAALILGGLVAGCGAGGAAAVDAGPDAAGVAFQATTIGEPGALEVWIAGAPRATWETTYADDHALLDALVPVELRDGDLVVDTYTINPGRRAAQCAAGEPAIGIREELCLLGHGELRFFAATVDFAGASCHYDGFCLPACSVRDPDACGAGQRCTATRAAAAAPWSRIECAPVGPRGAGEPCAWTSGAPGLDDRWIDDCGAGLFCHDGTCRPLCADAMACGLGTCATPSGAPDEITICDP